MRFVPPSRPLRARRLAPGFTLIELLIALVVLGILAAIAYPQYTDFVQRSRIADATSSLNDFRTRMEQFFQDNRRYDDGAGACGLADPAFVAESNFQVLCTLIANGYRVNANGSAAKGMGAFQYRLEVDNLGTRRSTVAVPAGWAASANCWTVRRNGYCS